MAKEFEVEYASFTKVKFEAESKEEAEMIASIMEGEEIEEKGECEGYVIWNEPEPVGGNRDEMQRLRTKLCAS